VTANHEKYKHTAEKLTRQKIGISNGLKIQIKYSAWCVTSLDGFFAECKSQQAAIQLANKLNKLRSLEQPW
jgi:hypothetical protein